MRNLKIAVAAALVALSLGGCAGGKLFGVIPVTGSVPNPVSNTRFVTIESTYGIAAAAANTYVDRYRKGFRCTTMNLESITNPCSRRSVALKMQEADRKAQIALGKARAFTLNNPTLDATSLLDAAQDAVSVLLQITQQN